MDIFVTHVWGKLSNKGNAVRNLVGKRWMTDNEVVFNMLNARQHSDFFFPTSHVDTYVQLSRTNYRMHQNTLESSIALNVGCKKDGTSYISTPENQGMHWSLLILDIKKSHLFIVIRKAGQCPVTLVILWDVTLPKLKLTMDY